MEALEASEARFRDFDQVAADWFFELDKDLCISYMSGENHIPSGRKTSEMIGLSEKDSFLGRLEDTDKWQKHLMHLEAREPFELEVEWAREDGSIVYVHNMGKPVFNANREFQGYRCCGTNISRQRQAEDAAMQSEQRFRDFAETAADWFWEQDADLRFTFLSANFPRFSRSPNKQFIGKNRQEIAGKQNFSDSHWRYLEQKQAAREAFSNFEYEVRSDEGKSFFVRISGKPIFNENGEFKGYRGSGIDITSSHQMSELLSYQASHDPLTGLVNRREFELRISKALKECENTDGEHALCYIDLDQFKVVNDSCGHVGGDKLLLKITALLKKNVRQNDTVARLGGDEFGLFFENCPLEQAAMIAEKVRKSVDEFRFHNDGKIFRIGVSIGLIPINKQSTDYSNVMRQADAACYAAKDSGRNRVHIYHEDNPEVVSRHVEMQRVVEINRAFDGKHFVLHQQAILDLRHTDNESKMFSEVLVRMIGDVGQLIFPGSFLGVAERYNLVSQLDTWVVKEAINWLCSERSKGNNIHCSVNLSGMSVASSSFLEFVLAELASSSVDPARICFEITETAAIENIDKAREFIGQLKTKGCLFALDDFGSGFSSFAYLKTLPVDFLKIDGFFVRDILKDSISYEMVKSINDIAHVMGKKTIAEFVEDEATLSALRDIGVDYAQGYAIARPEPL